MIAAHIESGEVSVRDVAPPKLRPGFALIRTMLAGICNTDLELQRGYYGFKGTPGHEFVGEVIACAEKAWIGKRVVGEINLACGRCAWCRRDLGRHCPRRTVLGIVKHPGAFAEMLTLPTSNLRKVPPRLIDEEAVFTEPVAAACEIEEQLGPLKGIHIGVLGDGKLGLLIAQVLQVRGARVTLFGRHMDKMKISASTGVKAMLASKGLPSAEFEVTVDATGSASGLEQAISMTRPRGRVVMKSTTAERAPIDMAKVIVNEIQLIGSRCGRFEPALQILRRREINVLDMISAHAVLTAASGAFATAASRGVLKILFDF